MTKNTEAVKALTLDDLDMATPSNAGIEFELKHPVTSEPLGWFVTVIGKNSGEYQSSQRKQINETLRKAHMARKRGKDVDIQTIEQIEESATKTLVECSKGWRSASGATLHFLGEDRVFSKENATLLYSSEKFPWVRKQVDEAISDDANFMKL